jgi:hypothetical protein
MTLHTSDERRGQALVEFALVIPIFLLVIFGILDLGRAVYAYSTLNNAAREGARVALVDQTLSHIQTVASGHAVGLGIPATAVTVDYRDPDDPDTPNSCAIWLGNPEPGLPVGCTAIVRVEYLYTAATPIIGRIVGDINMAGESSMAVQFACQEPSKPQCPVGD